MPIAIWIVLFFSCLLPVTAAPKPNLLVKQIPPLPDDDPEGALWKVEARREMLWAYDFNLAFDPDFKRERFFGAHVFGKMLKQSAPQ